MASKYADFVAVGPQSLAGRLLRQFWQPVFLSSRLARGRAAPLRILDEDFTLFRGESGSIGLVAPRCAHRGLPLSLGRVAGDHLSCLYHGWTYDGQGQCVAQPAEKRSFAESVRLAHYPAREYHGLIFAYFGPGEAPEFPIFAVLEQPGIVEARESRRAYPFFNQLENSVDEVHFNFVHRRSAFTDAGLNDEIPEITAKETDYGILRSGRRGNTERLSHIIMPNCMFASVYGHDKGWTEHFAWRVPIDRMRHTSFQLVMIHKSGAEADEYRALQARQKAELANLEPAERVVARVLGGEMHLDDVPDRPDLLSIQDAVAMQGQGADLDREKDWLGASDLQVRLLRQIWTREMRALDAGEPGKRWKVPTDTHRDDGS